MKTISVIKFIQCLGKTDVTKYMVVITDGDKPSRTYSIYQDEIVARGNALELARMIGATFVENGID